MQPDEYDRHPNNETYIFGAQESAQYMMIPQLNATQRRPIATRIRKE